MSPQPTPGSPTAEKQASPNSEKTSLSFADSNTEKPKGFKTLFKKKVPSVEDRDEKKLPPVPFFQLFRFADSSQITMLILGFVCSVVTGLLLPLNMLFFADFSGAFIKYSLLVETAPGKESKDYLKKEVSKFCLIFVGFAAVMFVFSYLQSVLFSISSEKQTLKIRETYYNSAIRQELGWFDQVSTGDLTTRISSDVSAIQDGIGVKLSYCIQYITNFIGGFILALVRGYKMALVLLAAIPLLMIIGSTMGINVGKYTKLIQDQYAKSGAIATEVISATRTVMAFNAQNRETVRYDNNNKKAAVLEKKKTYALALGLGGIFFFIYAVYALGFWYGAKLIRDGTYDASKVLSVSSLIDPFDSESGIKAENIKGEIELKNVTFSYPTRPDLPTLKNFSIKISPGHKIALVGESGCGKSTIIALIQRFYDVQQGSVLIDGIDVKDYNVTSLRQNISIVSQEPVLFDTTILQNIAWGAKDYDTNPPSKDQIVQACKDANIHDFIMSLPSQYDTFVGERGAQLSGGQKQRIAIARALIRNAPILLLDEATSALDTESERLVQEAIDKNIDNRTTISIAHRLSTIKDSDCIYVCSMGSVVEQGSHNDLIAKKGAYFALVNAQELRETDTKTFAKKSNIPDKIISTRVVESKKSITSDLKSSDEEAIKTNLSDIGSLFYLFKVYRSDIKLFLLGSLGSIADGILFPLFSIFFSKILVAFAIPDLEEQKKETNKYALIFLIIAIITFFAVSTRTVFFNFGSIRLSHKLRYDLFNTIICQESEYFDKKENGTGAITTRLSSEPENIQKFGAESLPMIISSCTSLITGVCIAFTIDWRLTLIVMACVPILAFSEGQKSKVLTGRAKQNQIVIEAGAKEAYETISNIRTVASLTREVTFIKSFNNNNKKPHMDALKSSYTSAITFGFAQCFVFLIYSLAFYSGSRFVLNGSLTVQAMFNTIYAMLFAAIALGQASQFLGFVPKAVVAAIKINEEFKKTPKINIKSIDGNSPSEKNGTIAASDIEFTYPSRPDIKILKSISLHAQPGKTIALVGGSGSGKSTVINLIMRLYDVESGSIEVEKTDVRNWKLKDLRDHPSLVSQEPVLFDYSISENIKYGRPDSTEYEVEQAARAANIHNMIMELPDGYHTRAGVNGGQLSGGQKQRVAIARAIIRNPEILLLDEATSALDTESEMIVQKALDEASEGRTTVIIAHRLSTIQNADWIYVFDRGEIAEEGTHDSLTERKGIYYSLAVQQSLSQ
ncbi:hypothetical protein BB561_003074 [Smittium simulii]|uniref:Bile salt export pump n=1 Tax=Smittium simulii TaxID=133385 RepID=A0A2T9YN36_9FUNG|nr:hypothetical protein BB561_003074 [Smittium simulii]